MSYNHEITTQQRIARLLRIRDIPANAKLLLIVIEIAEKINSDNQVALSTPQLAQLLGCSERTVCSVRDILYDNKLLHINTIDHHNAPYLYAINYLSPRMPSLNI